MLLNPNPSFIDDADGDIFNDFLNNINLEPIKMDAFEFGAYKDEQLERSVEQQENSCEEPKHSSVSR
jgi:hypothetical protein